MSIKFIASIYSSAFYLFLEQCNFKSEKVLLISFAVLRVSSSRIYHSLTLLLYILH